MDKFSSIEMLQKRLKYRMSLHGAAKANTRRYYGELMACVAMNEDPYPWFDALFNELAKTRAHAAAIGAISQRLQKLGQTYNFTDETLAA